MHFLSLIIAFAVMSLSLAAPIPIPGEGAAPDEAGNCGPGSGCVPWKREE